ncbi:MAG: hypothetical protein ACOX5Y_01245 [Acholeplasmataceae bacterium]|jgi:hypothetical protein
MKLFKKYGGFVALLFAVLALVMLFIEPAILIGEVFGNRVEGFTGFEAIFGTKENQFGIQALKASGVGIVALILLVVGAAVPLVPMVPEKLRFLVGAGVLLVAGILFFVIPGGHGDGFKPATSLILAGVFSLVAFLVDGALAVLHLQK